MTRPSPENGPGRRSAVFLLQGSRTFGRIADSLRRQGYGVEHGPTARVSALYADTWDGRLLKRGLRLRFVREGTSRRWILEGPPSPPCEQLVLPAEAPPTGECPVLHIPDGPVAEAVAALAGSRALLALIGADTVESAYLLATPSGARMAVSVQRFRARPARGPGSAAGTLVTLELLEGAEESLAHLEGYLVHHRGLLPTRGDLLAMGIQSLGVRPPGGQPPEALQIRAGDPLAAAARKTLARQTLRLEENREGTVGGWDDEFLHDMRVAVRRLRSALRLFAPHLGPARSSSLRNELKWLGDGLGSVRDLDVFLAGLGGTAARAGLPPEPQEALRRRIEALRQQRRATLVRALESARYRRVLARLESLARPRTARGAALPPVSEAAPPLMGRAAAKALRAASGLGADPTPEALHRSRILFKRARYACEFFREAFGDPLDPFINEAVAFQDLLGTHQDSAVAVGLVRWAAGEMHASGDLDLPGSLGMGALIHVYLESAQRDRRAVLKHWSTSRKGLRKLREEIWKLGGNG